MKLVASMKAQAPSKTFAQPQAAQTPSCDTWVLLQSANGQYANSSTEGKHFPGRAGKQSMESVSVVDVPGKDTKEHGYAQHGSLAILAS